MLDFGLRHLFLALNKKEAFINSENISKVIKFKHIQCDIYDKAKRKYKYTLTRITHRNINKFGNGLLFGGKIQIQNERARRKFFKAVFHLCDKKTRP